MTPRDKYFKIAAKIWEMYFETRAGKRFGENALSMKKRDELLEELRVTIKFKESKLDDKKLIEDIARKRAQALSSEVNNAFKK
jgi:hypothetical protein